MRSIGEIGEGGGGESDRFTLVFTDSHTFVII